MGKRYMNRQVPKEEMANKYKETITLTINWIHTNKITDYFSPKKLLEKIWGDNDSHKLLEMLIGKTFLENNWQSIQQP